MKRDLLSQPAFSPPLCSVPGCGRTLAYSEGRPGQPTLYLCGEHAQAEFDRRREARIRAESVPAGEGVR